MRKLLMVAAVALLPLTAQAQLSLGVRAGYALPMGDYTDTADASLSDFFDSHIPIQLDAMYEFMPDLAIGAYFSYGIGQLDLDGECDLDGVDCSGRVLRLGLQASYTFSKLIPTFTPWLGVGAGYEWTTIDEEAMNLKWELDAHGFEFLNVQAGADYKVNEQFSVGPYVQASVGQYRRVAFDVPTFDAEGAYMGQVSAREDIEDKGIHEWISFGLRGKFDL